jgi:SAM-dependent methyltransferase
MSDSTELRVRLDAAIRELGEYIRRAARTSGDSALAVMATDLYLSQYRDAHLAVARALPAGSDLLDWGAGIGHFAFVQTRLGNRVTAYTPEPTEYNCYNDTLAELQRAAGFEMRVGRDPVALPFDDATFDGVVSCGVLEHVREFGGDDAGSVREIARILKPGGAFFCLHLPNRRSWIEWMHRRSGSSHHAFIYGVDDIRRLLAGSGLSLAHHYRYGTLPKIQLARALGPRADDRRIVRAYYAMDGLLDRLAGPIAQNHFFVAKKGEAGASRRDAAAGAASTNERRQRVAGHV